MKLIDCFIPFFALVRHFQLAPEGDAAALSARLNGMVNEARNRSRDAGYADADTEREVMERDADCRSYRYAERDAGASRIFFTAHSYILP